MRKGKKIINALYGLGKPSIEIGNDVLLFSIKMQGMYETLKTVSNKGITTHVFRLLDKNFLYESFYSYEDLPDYIIDKVYQQITTPKPIVSRTHYYGVTFDEHKRYMKNTQENQNYLKEKIGAEFFNFGYGSYIEVDLQKRKADVLLDFVWLYTDQPDLYDIHAMDIFLAKQFG